MVDKVKRLLRVDSDDTEELHNKFRETSRDREEKIKLFEEQLNIKARKLRTPYLTPTCPSASSSSPSWSSCYSLSSSHSRYSTAQLNQIIINNSLAHISHGKP